MDFLKEWEEKLGIKITCSQVRLGGNSGARPLRSQSDARAYRPHDTCW
jgi:hypothetical protein